MNMISILILVGICLTADAKPNPIVGSYVVDGVQGVLYEVPEYEDPELALLQLSALGVMPVLTLLHEADSPDGEDASCMEEFADVKKGLDGIIVGLEDARTKFEEGSTEIENDIGKSITHLMKLKHHLQTHINHAISVDRESGASYGDGQERIPQAEESSTQVSTTTEGSDVKDGNHDIAKIITIADAIMVSEPREKSVNGFLKFKQPLHKLNDPLASYDNDPSETYVDIQELSKTDDVDNQEASDTYDVDNQEASETYEDNHESILESQKIPTQLTTSSEMSDTEDSKPELVDIKTVGEGIVVSGKNKYQDVGKAVFRKKWSWKSSNEDE